MPANGFHGSQGLGPSGLWDSLSWLSRRTKKTGQDSWLGGFESISWFSGPGSVRPVGWFALWVTRLSCCTRKTDQDCWLNEFESIPLISGPGSPRPVGRFDRWLTWLSCRTKKVGQGKWIGGFDLAWKLRLGGLVLVGATAR